MHIQKLPKYLTILISIILIYSNQVQALCSITISAISIPDTISTGVIYKDATWTVSNTGTIGKNLAVNCVTGVTPKSTKADDCPILNDMFFLGPGHQCTLRVDINGSEYPDMMIEGFPTITYASGGGGCPTNSEDLLPLTKSVISSGPVKCWGTNTSGELGQDNMTTVGNNTTNTIAKLDPVNLGTGRTAKSLTTSSNSSCALLDDNTVKCWGDNVEGQLGQNNTTLVGDGGGGSVSMSALNPINLGSGLSATKITGGQAYFCALLNTNQIKCWGVNLSGQLGQSSTNSVGNGIGTNVDVINPIALGGTFSAKDVVAGDSFTCALLNTNQVKCWGNNASGQLGINNTTNRGDTAATSVALTPVINLGTGLTAKAIAAGDNFACALLSNDQVKCWGNNVNGQLGQSDTTKVGDGVGPTVASIPVINLGTGLSAKAISAGGSTACALLSNDKVKCWGLNTDGQLGINNTTNRGDTSATSVASTPVVNLGTGLTAKAILANSSFTCALLSNDKVKCWGANLSGQLGQNNTTTVGDGGLPTVASISGIDFGTGLSALNITQQNSSNIQHMCIALKAG